MSTPLIMFYFLNWSFTNFAGLPDATINIKMGNETTELAGGAAIVAR